MQPESTRVTQKSSSPEVVRDTNYLHHHGPPEQEEHTLGDISSGEREGTGFYAANSSAATSAGLAATGPARSKPPVARLSSASPRPSKSPVDRVSEHEQASFNISKKSNDGPAFTVLPIGKRSAPTQVHITDFPNG